MALNAETARTTAARLDAEALARRFQDAASQLGNGNAAIRLAGVYSMARLADDWEDQRQTCIEVLCAYLRISAAADVSGEVQHGERQVQQTIINLIIEHLSIHAIASKSIASWADNWIDLSGIEVTDFRLGDAAISAGFKMENAVFRGRTQFHAVKLPESGELSLAGCTVAGEMTMTLDALEGEFVLDHLKVGVGAEFFAHIDIGLLGDYQVSAQDMSVAGLARICLASGTLDERGDTSYSVLMTGVTIEAGGSFKLVVEPDDEPPVELFIGDWMLGAGTDVELPANAERYTPWEPRLLDPSARVVWK